MVQCMPDSPPPLKDDDLQLLSVMLMDLRSTVEAMRRSVTNAQSSIEQYRHTQSQLHLEDIADCLFQLRRECTIVTDSAAKADQILVISDTDRGDRAQQRRTIT